MQVVFMSIIIDIKVIPRASKKLLKAYTTYDMRCYVISAAEDNKANEEVMAFLADKLGISKRSITLIAGATSCIKRLSIDGFSSKQEIFTRVGLEVQHALF